MAHRIFVDTDGIEWQVWDVVPHVRWSPQRRDDRRVSPDPAYAGPERRWRDRRTETPAPLRPDYEHGWLCFEGTTTKRRLSPVPNGWDQCPSQELEQLCHRAEPVSRR